MSFRNVFQDEPDRVSDILIVQIEQLEHECLTYNGNHIDLLMETDLNLLLVEAKKFQGLAMKIM